MRKNVLVHNLTEQSGEDLEKRIDELFSSQFGLSGDTV